MQRNSQAVPKKWQIGAFFFEDHPCTIRAYHPCRTIGVPNNCTPKNTGIAYAEVRNASHGKIFIQWRIFFSIRIIPYRSSGMRKVSYVLTNPPEKILRRLSLRSISVYLSKHHPLNSTSYIQPRELQNNVKRFI